MVLDLLFVHVQMLEADPNSPDSLRMSVTYLLYYLLKLCAVHLDKIFQCHLACMWDTNFLTVS